MNAEEFYKEFDRIVEETNEKVAELVHRAQEEEGLDWNTDKEIHWHDDPTIERRIDNLACIAGWVSDRLKGINRLHKKSLTKKIRKALGYTYP